MCISIRSFLCLRRSSMLICFFSTKAASIIGGCFSINPLPLSNLTRYMPVRCNGGYLYTNMSLFSDAIKNQLNNHNK
jgi:hypothetical protein